MASGTLSTHLESLWTDVRGKLMQVISRFRDAGLSYRPYDASWTVRELLLHIAHEELGEVQHGITRRLSAWPDAFPADDHPSIASIAARLDRVHGEALALLAGLDDEALGQTVETPWGVSNTRLALLGHVIEHEIHHRAELSLILGMLGRPGLDA